MTILQSASAISFTPTLWLVPQCLNDPPCLCRICRNADRLAEKQRIKLAEELRRLGRYDTTSKPSDYGRLIVKTGGLS